MCNALPQDRPADTAAATPPEGALAYTVYGMGCGGCKAKVTRVVSEVAGVEQVDVDLDSLRLTVVGTDVDQQAVRAAVEGAGYELEPVT